jgi:RNA polymerase sigma factor (sigma-70 family)
LFVGLFDCGDASDAALLARFARDRDEAAFAALVRRHGPMVLGVCRRIVGDTHLADDAFQASFLVLARKCATVRPGSALAGWLHGVGRRAALEARTLARRRALRETTMATLPDVAMTDPERPDPDLLARLDRAIAGLPESLRSAVVLCELEGRSRAEAATMMGIPEGTLSSRLATARRRLTRALKGSGSAPLALAGLVAGVSSALTSRAVSAAMSPEQVSTRVAAMAAGVSRMMYATKLQVLAAVAVLVAAAGVLAWPSKNAKAGDPPTKTVAVREPQILIWTQGKAALLKPDGTVVRSWDGEQVPNVYAARLSPDGKRIAVLRTYETRTQKKNVDVGGGATLAGSFGRTLHKLMICDVADKLSGPDVEVPGDSVYNVVWSGDGTKLYVGSHDDDPSYDQANNLRHWTINAKTLKATEFKLPEGHHLIDVSNDGTQYLTKGPIPIATVCRPIWIVPADGSKQIRMTDTTEGEFDARFSPDGKQILVCGAGLCAAGSRPDGSVGPGRVAASKCAYWFDLMTIADGKRTNVLVCKEKEYVWICCWSPDGKRIAYLPRQHSFPDVHDELTISDPDGGGAKVLMKIDHAGNALVDWR